MHLLRVVLLLCASLSATTANVASPTTFVTITSVSPVIGREAPTQFRTTHVQHTPPPHGTGPAATCTPTITPDKNGYVPPGSCDANYDYYPSFGAAVTAGAIFGFLSLLHTGQAIWYKKAFCWVLIMGSLWEMASYASRAAGTRDQQSVTKLLIAQVFVLLAPLWLNAFDYMVLSRMIHFFTPTHSVWGIRASTLSTYFVFLDISAFIVQLVGTLMTNSTTSLWKGTHIYMGGLGLQEFFIMGFLCFGIRFHITMLNLERKGQLPYEKQRWRRLLYTLYGSLLFITVRIIFRLIEFSAGPGTNNPLPYHEAYFYVFDAIPMAIAILIMSITHPGSILQGPDSVFPKSQCCAKRSAKKALRRETKVLLAQERLEKKRSEKSRKKSKRDSGYIEMLPTEEQDDVRN